MKRKHSLSYVLSMISPEVVYHPVTISFPEPVIPFSIPVLLEKRNAGSGNDIDPVVENICG